MDQDIPCLRHFAARGVERVRTDRRFQDGGSCPTSIAAIDDLEEASASLVHAKPFRILLEASLAPLQVVFERMCDIQMFLQFVLRNPTFSAYK